MAKVFLDTNIFIDCTYRRPEIKKHLDGCDLFTSPLSIHILCYVNKITIPDPTLNDNLSLYNLVSFTSEILEKALIGPTKDIEDNIQLHSAAISGCEYFLTSDKTLLSLKFFGTTKIVSQLP